MKYFVDFDYEDGVLRLEVENPTYIPRLGDHINVWPEKSSSSLELEVTKISSALTFDGSLSRGVKKSKEGNITIKAKIVSKD